MITFKIQHVCVTRGAGGCQLFAPSQQVDVAGRNVNVVDTVGSGDAFTAAFIHGLLQHWPLQSIAQFANEVGTLMATQQGAMPDLRDEYERLLGRFGASVTEEKS